MSQRCLADARQVFDQQMSTRQQASNGEANLVLLAEDDTADLGYNGGKRI